MRLGDWHFDEVKADSLQRAAEAFIADVRASPPTRSSPAPSTSSAGPTTGWTTSSTRSSRSRGCSTTTWRSRGRPAGSRAATSGPRRSSTPPSASPTRPGAASSGRRRSSRRRAGRPLRGRGLRPARRRLLRRDEVRARGRGLPAGARAPRRSRRTRRRSRRRSCSPGRATGSSTGGEGARAARRRPTPRARPGGRRTRATPTCSPRVRELVREEPAARARASTTRRRRASSRRGSSRRRSRSTASPPAPTATTSARFPHSKQAYELSYNYADCLYNALEFDAAARVYAAVRDDPADDQYEAEAALSAVISWEGEITRLQRQRRARGAQGPPLHRPPRAGGRPASRQIPYAFVHLVRDSDVLARALPDAREGARPSPTRPPRSSTSTATSTRRAAGFEEVVARWPRDRGRRSSPRTSSSRATSR